MEDPTTVQSATAVVSLSQHSQQELFQKQGHLPLGDVLSLTCLNTLTLALSQTLTPQVVSDVLCSHQGSSHNQYELCRKSFQHLLAWWLIMYISEDGIFQFLSSLSGSHLAMVG